MSDWLGKGARVKIVGGSMVGHTGTVAKVRVLFMNERLVDIDTNRGKRCRVAVHLMNLERA